MSKDRKRWYLLLRKFWALLQKINFWGQIGLGASLGMSLCIWGIGDYGLGESLCIHSILSLFYLFLSLKFFGSLYAKSIYYTRCPIEVPLCLRRIKIERKHSKLQIYYVTGCLEMFYLHFTLLAMIQVFGNSPILIKTEKFDKESTSCSWNVSILIFNLKQICKIVPIGNCSIWNFLATYFDYIFIKSLRKASKILKMLRNWGLRETGTSYRQRCGFRVDRWPNMWLKVNKLSKIG